jgi:hypothetical protein
MRALCEKFNATDAEIDQGLSSEWTRKEAGVAFIRTPPLRGEERERGGVAEARTQRRRAGEVGKE